MKKKIKVILESSLENQNFECDGIVNNNKISYKDGDIIVTVETLGQKLLIKRKHKEYEIHLNLQNNQTTNSIYTLFGMPKEFILVTNTKKLEINENKIIADYEIEGDKYLFILEVL